MFSIIFVCIEILSNAQRSWLFKSTWHFINDPSLPSQIRNMWKDFTIKYQWSIISNIMDVNITNINVYNPVLSFCIFFSVAFTYTTVANKSCTCSFVGDTVSVTRRHLRPKLASQIDTWIKKIEKQYDLCVRLIYNKFTSLLAIGYIWLVFCFSVLFKMKSHTDSWVKIYFEWFEVEFFSMSALRTCYDKCNLELPK